MERVATLWIGAKFSFPEHLCLKSFADADQKPIVYHYGDLEDIPDYIEARDAREIFDTPEIYRDPVTRSVAVHADLFRLKLLQKTDYIWADADAYAVRPFETKDGYLFPIANRGRRRIMSGVWAMPGESPALQNMCKYAFDSDLTPAWWSDQKKEAYRAIFETSTYWSLPLFSFGPPMLFHYIFDTPEHKMAGPRPELYPIPLRHRYLWNDPDMSKLEFLKWDKKMSIHFYGSWFRKIFQGRKISEGSLVDTLLCKHGIDPSNHPI
ncbi:hypothetical protein [Ruegeria arenilitoris]|uniref:hypothetical protein n=1 Tax=Ruegeria arenilitoris TaxID=1173585 RepID=UPI001479D260|nr:hypothetical protein [Ruegeria arenilitoris]